MILVRGFLWWVWDLVHDLARQLPYDGPQQDRLAAVIGALHALPPRTVKLGGAWGRDNEVPLWTHLPMFGNTFRESSMTVSHAFRLLSAQLT